tara:strand:+ start:18842 stop:19114 length:273 start_codon:yes stop_codon:yes gene_type:complete
MPDLNDSTVLSIPLRNLIAIIVAVAVAVIGYFEIDERIMMLEHETDRIQLDVETNADWIDNWESDGILPLDVEQNMKIEHLEWKLEKLGF